MQPLLAAVHAVLEAEALADDPSRDTATAIADLLGTQVAILSDRLKFLGARELASGLGALYGRISWPELPERFCIQQR